MSIPPLFPDNSRLVNALNLPALLVDLEEEEELFPPTPTTPLFSAEPPSRSPSLHTPLPPTPDASPPPLSEASSPLPIQEKTTTPAISNPK